jgi:hypothetical protein
VGSGVVGGDIVWNCDILGLFIEDALVLLFHMCVPACAYTNGGVRAIAVMKKK